MLCQGLKEGRRSMKKEKCMYDEQMERNRANLFSLLSLKICQDIK